MMSKLSEKEFEILDELYFLVSFEELANTLDMEQNILKQVLGGMIEKRWVKCFTEPEQDIDYHDVDFLNQFDKYHYLASKEGLFIHNSM